MYESNKVISKSAKKASQKARRRARRNDVPITYLLGENIIIESSSGSKVIGRVSRRNSKTTNRLIKLT